MTENISGTVRTHQRLNLALKPRCARAWELGIHVQMIGAQHVDCQQVVRKKQKLSDDIEIRTDS